MNILAIITHEDPSFVGISLDGVVMEHRFEKSRLVAEQLAEISVALLKFHNKSIKDIDAVAVIVGPGSYTGIRVGMAFAKSVVQFSERKLFAISPFDVLKFSSGISTPANRPTGGHPSRGKFSCINSPHEGCQLGRNLAGWISSEGDNFPLIDAGRGNVYILEDGIVNVKTFDEVKAKYDSQVFIGSGAVANSVEVPDNLRNITVQNLCDFVDSHSPELKNYNSDFDTFVKLVPNYVQEARIG